MSESVVTAVSDLVAPILSDLGLELYDCEFSGGTLKVTIDTPAGQPSGVDIDRIALVTRLLGRELDHRDVVPGRYTLEVTSPGLERPLRTPGHFRREVGKTVNIRLARDLDGRRRLVGVLVSASDASAVVCLEDNGSTVEVDYGLIDRAKTVFVWQAQPKPNSPEARRARAKGPVSPTSPSPQEVSAS